jgi:hypothetical protein
MEVADKGKKKGLTRRMGTAIGNYARKLALDYTTVAKDIVHDSRQRPFKVFIFIVKKLDGF